MNLEEKESQGFIAMLHGHEKVDASAVAPVSLAPPVTYAALKIASFFEGDEDVFAIPNYDTASLKLMVKGAKKAEAINYLIRNKIDLGNQILSVRVFRILENGDEQELPSATWTENVKAEFEYLKTMMDGNPIDSVFNTVYDPICGVTYYFMELGNIACRYKVDNLRNPCGFECALPEDVFKYSFRTNPRIYVSTYTRDWHRR